MATTVPTIKRISLANEDLYRKETMIARLKARRMLNVRTEQYIRKGK